MELNLNNEVNKNLVLEDELKIEQDNRGVNKTIDDIEKELEKNIAEEVEKIDVNDSIWEKINKGSMKDIAKVSIEGILKGTLKKKLNINFSTFNDMKDAITSIMSGDLKEAIKKGSDVAIDRIKILDSTTKAAIKSIKNAVIDKTINTEKYEIVNRQTKIIDRIGKNCEEFNKAIATNDEKIIKKEAKAIKKDMESILPIRETIIKAQKVLDTYSLWENKGKTALTMDEIELINKLNKCA